MSIRISRQSRTPIDAKGNEVRAENETTHTKGNMSTNRLIRSGIEDAYSRPIEKHKETSRKTTKNIDREPSKKLKNFKT